VRKVFLGPLALRRPRRQVVPNYSQCQDEKVASSCQVCRVKLSHMRINNSHFCQWLQMKE